MKDNDSMDMQGDAANLDGLLLREFLCTVHGEIKSALTNRFTADGHPLPEADWSQPEMERLMTAVATSSFFHFLCLLDGVADPEHTPVEEWYGVHLRPRTEDDSDVPFLHDQLYEIANEVFGREE